MLKSLRGRLDRVAAGQTADDADLQRLDIAWLTGSSRDEILEALGEPDYCVQSQGRGAYGVSFPSVPCEQGNDDLVYRFYHLPPGGRGGGQELRLVFGERGTCTSSFWELTQ